MTLTLADLDRWGPTPSIVCSRPRSTAPTGVRSTATQIGDVMAPTLWEGDSHDAAMGATGRIQDDLLNHAEECEAVGRAARAAEAEVCDIQRDWHDVQRMADHRGIAINTETGELSYIPPPDPSDRAEMERRVDIIENEIRALRARRASRRRPRRRDPGGRRSGKRGRPQPTAADHPPVPMDEEQGNADAQELAQHGTLSPDAQARLNAATTLSPDQQAALERGDLVLPHDQMAYLSAMSRGRVAIRFAGSLLDGGGPIVVGLLVLGGVLYNVAAILYGLRWPNPWPHTFDYHEFFTPSPQLRR